MVLSRTSLKNVVLDAVCRFFPETCHSERRPWRVDIVTTAGDLANLCLTKIK